jgi:transposase
LISDKERIVELEAKVIRLELIIVELLKRIDELTHRKNSVNSSISPSKDENRLKKNQSLRVILGKKQGAQPGHEGSTLLMIETPDIVINHIPEFCTCCGDSIQSIKEEFIQKRQVVDIPRIYAQYTEHRIYKKTCICGHETKAGFPENVNTNISYGSNIEASIAYLHARQYLPYERMSEFFKDFCNLSISQGTISNLLNKFTKKAMPAYDLIHTKLSSQTVVGSDETGIRINGKKGWFWTWQNKVATFITYSDNRGYASIEKHFVKGFEQAILVHDCWASQFKTECKTHQLCIAHLIRELVYFEEKYESNWASNFKRMLYQSLELKKQLKEVDYLYPIKEKKEIQDDFEKMLQQTIPEKQNDLVAFHKRITKYKDYLFVFLEYYDVPPDNNGSERAIRNIKVKQKISGHFKTENGAQIYAIIRSITDTCIKNRQNILQCFKTIACLRAE